MSADEILVYCLGEIKNIQNEETTLNSQREEAISFYNSEKIGNEIKGRSQVVTSDFADTVEWLMPPIMDAVQAYAGVGEICSVMRTVFGDYRAPTAV